METGWGFWYGMVCYDLMGIYKFLGEDTMFDDKFC
jgi:hypothetical protein